MSSSASGVTPSSPVTLSHSSTQPISDGDRKEQALLEYINDRPSVKIPNLDSLPKKVCSRCLRAASSGLRQLKIGPAIPFFSGKAQAQPQPSVSLSDDYATAQAYVNHFHENYASAIKNANTVPELLQLAQQYSQFIDRPAHAIDLSERPEKPFEVHVCQEIMKDFHRLNAFLYDASRHTKLSPKQYKAHLENLTSELSSKYYGINKAYRELKLPQNTPAGMLVDFARQFFKATSNFSTKRIFDARDITERSSNETFVRFVPANVSSSLNQLLRSEKNENFNAFEDERRRNIIKSLLLNSVEIFPAF